MNNYRPTVSAILFVMALFLAQSAPAAAGQSLLKPYKLSYTTTYKFLLPLQGTAVREMVKTEDNRWQINHKIDSAVIKLRESSLFSYTENRIQPVDYHYRQSALAKDREVSLLFDWPRMLATNTAEDPNIDIKLVPDALDKLNYQLQLRIDLATLSQPGVYQLVDRKRLKEYRFEVLGEELLETAVGKLKTLKLRRLREPDASRETVIWLAKDWDYLLVQVQQEERGKSYEILLSDGELDGTPIRGIEH